MAHVVIAGAGQAGLQVAASLRETGFAGEVTLINAEPGLPYQRPPLSKGYLAGKVSAEQLLLKPQAFFQERNVDLRSNVAVVGLDRAAQHVYLASSEVLTYDHLVLALGARNRVLPVPGTELNGVVYLRTHADADGLRLQLAAGLAIVVIGAGFIGLEFAAQARALGCGVTVIEALSRPMARVVSGETSAFFTHAHKATGISFEFGANVAAIEGQHGKVTGVRTGDGRSFTADLVVVGIGVIPNVEIAQDAGLHLDNGIVVDEHLLTADPAISAVGDCAAHPSLFAGRRVRIESVQNAVDQARTVAMRLAGRPAPYDAVPWFWSDQGPYKLQIAGLTTGFDHTVLRGDPADGAFSVFCYSGDRLLGVETVNQGGDHMAARRILASGASVTPEQAADPGIDLKSFITTTNRQAR